jgi:hypothetical protein
VPDAVLTIVAARRALADAAQHLAQHEERPAQVDRDDAIELGELDLGQRHDRALDAGVVVQRVDRAKSFSTSANARTTSASSVTSARTPTRRSLAELLERPARSRPR